MEYHGEFGHNIGRIQHISLMSIIDTWFTSYRLATQTVTPTLPSFQGIKRCVQYLDSHTHTPIFILLILMMAQILSDIHGVYKSSWRLHNPKNIIIPSRCRSWYYSHQKTVSFRFFSYSPFCYCLLESTDSTRYSLWIHGLINWMYLQGCQ